MRLIAGLRGCPKAIKCNILGSCYLLSELKLQDGIGSYFIAPLLNLRLILWPGIGGSFLSAGTGTQKQTSIFPVDRCIHDPPDIFICLA
jgi:hypothetical protein